MKLVMVATGAMMLWFITLLEQRKAPPAHGVLELDQTQTESDDS